MDHCALQSGQSVISLLSSEELKKLLEEVKVLDEATLKVGFSREPLRRRGPCCELRLHPAQAGGEATGVAQAPWGSRDGSAQGLTQTWVVSCPWWRALRPWCTVRLSL